MVVAGSLGADGPVKPAGSVHTGYRVVGELAAGTATADGNSPGHTTAGSDLAATGESTGAPGSWQGSEDMMPQPVALELDLQLQPDSEEMSWTSLEVVLGWIQEP